jgi:hypothetical protein
MEQQLQRYQEDNEARDTMLMMAGVSLVIFGTGLILSNPIVRKYMGQMGLGGLNMLQAAVPDIERYLKIRNM